MAIGQETGWTEAEAVEYLDTHGYSLGNIVNFCRANLGLPDNAPLTKECLEFSQAVFDVLLQRKRITVKISRQTYPNSCGLCIVKAGSELMKMQDIRCLVLDALQKRLPEALTVGQLYHPVRFKERGVSIPKFLQALAGLSDPLFLIYRVQDSGISERD